MLFYKILFFFNFINLTNCFNLCIVGAYSELGKELVYQSIEDKNLKVLALTSNSELLIPSKGDILNNNKDLALLNYWEHIDLPYENIIFCTSAKPFEKDYSDVLTAKFLCHLPKECKTIHLVSAFGVGDSLNNANLGIKIMDKLYLKDVYRAKNKQEELLNNYDGNVEKFIYRPKALSYGDTLLDSTKRQDFAKEILKNLN